MNIFFTCAGRRTYLLQYFKEQLRGDGLIVAGDMQLSAPALSAADVKLQLPTVYADDYVPNLLEACQKYYINLLISLNDLELPILSTHKQKFTDIGTTVVISSPEVIDICFDKMKTAKFVNGIGLKAPQTYVSLQNAIQALNSGQLSFPVIIKPRWGSGSIGIEIAEDMDELKMVYNLLRHKVKKTILANVSQDDNYLMIQQMIKGHEFGLDIINNLQGDHVAVSVKQKLAMRAGETDKAITIDNSELRNIGSIIGKSLGHVGNLDCDILEENGVFYVLELNPRFGGGFPFSYEAGVNLPGAMIAWAKQEVFDTRNLYPRYGELYAKCDRLVRMS